MIKEPGGAATASWRSTDPVIGPQLVAVPHGRTFEPFGATTTSGATSANAQQFTGRENDGTGLYFYRARYYDPTFGRFLSEDPIRFQAGANFTTTWEMAPSTR